MKNKDTLDFRGFYKQTPLRVGDGGWTMLEFFEEDLEVECFLKNCTFYDFIYVIVTLFKDKYPNTGSLSFHIAKDNIESTINKNIKTYIRKPKHRNDIKEFVWVYDLEDPLIKHHYHLKSLEIKFKDTIDINKTKTDIEEALKGKTFTKEGSKFIVDNSAIDYIEITSNSFYLKVNESKTVHY